MPAENFGAHGDDEMGTKTRTIALPMFLALMLSACDGRDDRASPIPSPAPTPSPTPIPDVVVNVVGKLVVTEASGAQVHAKVGDQVFETTTDADGNYAIELRVALPSLWRQRSQAIDTLWNCSRI
jgi:hypothetical protein